ncbi:hypothetical protein L1267_14335 [Pseudoalteromonas sp. OFAV1]|uniref:hypothetical protein n=1 Tax=Pseudoalteromonas sp. OFAV1 TaxID=2908892 RepID=UPI001F2D7CE2|nr:hypothetical protein [Pseudoalteromonas sp. OFAV1]MCF2901555.1 hypothetical protein [Pseudoalteromonas sp. OFAV1]
MRKTEIKKLKKWVYFSPAIGVIIGFIYFLIKAKYSISLGFTDIRTLATIVAGFSFTMLGFLAAMATFLFSLQKYKFFKRWLEDGNAEVFFSLYKVSIVCLFITFAASLITFTSQGQHLSFKIMMMFIINNIVQLSVITLVLVNKISSIQNTQ